MKLSHRLNTIASFVRKGSIVADIGTDHGYIPIYLVQNGTALSALAMDVRHGPLERAAAHVREYGLEKQISLRLSDGLAELLPGEADTVIIAGMGGELICRILFDGCQVLKCVEHLVLSPQSELGGVRRYLEEAGFAIVKEAMLVEEGKYYTVMEACPGIMHYERPCDYEYGKYLIDEKDSVLLEYLKKEKNMLVSLLVSLTGQQSERAKKRRNDLEEKQDMIEEALRRMKGRE